MTWVVNFPLCWRERKKCELIKKNCGKDGNNFHSFFAPTLSFAPILYFSKTRVLVEKKATLAGKKMRKKYENSRSKLIFIGWNENNVYLHGFRFVFRPENISYLIFICLRLIIFIIWWVFSKLEWSGLRNEK